MDPQINLDSFIFHKYCAKCADCNGQITLNNFAMMKGEQTPSDLVLLCKTHYAYRCEVRGF